MTPKEMALIIDQKQAEIVRQHHEIERPRKSRTAEHIDMLMAEVESLKERAERAEAGLDALGVAIANAGYVWTPEMRAAYEKATNREG